MCQTREGKDERRWRVRKRAHGKVDFYKRQAGTYQFRETRSQYLSAKCCASTISIIRINEKQCFL